MVWENFGKKPRVEGGREVTGLVLLEYADSVKSAGQILLTYINMHDKFKSLVKNIK